MELKGKITQVNPTQTLGQNGFKKASIWIETTGDYPQTIEPGEILVDFKDNVTYEEITPIIESYNLTVITIHDWSSQGYYSVTVRVPVGEEEAMAETLSQHPAVASASPNYLDLYV